MAMIEPAHQPPIEFPSHHSDTHREEHSPHGLPCLPETKPYQESDEACHREDDGTLYAGGDVARDSTQDDRGDGHQDEGGDVLVHESAHESDEVRDHHAVCPPLPFDAHFFGIELFDFFEPLHEVFLCVGLFDGEPEEVAELRAVHHIPKVDLDGVIVGFTALATVRL
jgi:hypothetical protein